jgi:phosphopantothenoylcysteine decarboxylase/phosphopantothenate--cysteine ligase
MPDTSSQSQPLAGKELILAVCGGISAYKSADLCSKLVQAGAGVTVCMTRSGTEFVTPLTFQALSRRPVRTSTFELPDSSDPQHIALTEKADLMLIAPATANILAKAATGICDDLVSVMICAAACPVVFCPAMNNLMWSNPITHQNVQKLQNLGYRFIGPEEGWLACRSTGPGRMSEPAAILAEVTRMLTEPSARPSPVPRLGPPRSDRPTIV